MSQHGAEFHRWLNGEFRTDGFQSEWKKGQLRRRAEEMGKRQFVSAPQTKARQVTRTYSDPERQREKVRTSLQRRRLRLQAEGICRDCGKSKAKEGCTSCDPCLKARYQRQKARRAELRAA
jgi:hypothetical protein